MYSKDCQTKAHLKKLFYENICKHEFLFFYLVDKVTMKKKNLLFFCLKEKIKYKILVKLLIKRIRKIIYNIFILNKKT